MVLGQEVFESSRTHVVSEQGGEHLVLNEFVDPLLREFINGVVESFELREVGLDSALDLPYLRAYEKSDVVDEVLGRVVGCLGV